MSIIDLVGLFIGCVVAGDFITYLIVKRLERNNEGDKKVDQQ